MDEGTAAKLRGLVTGSVDKSVFADADFVIEAVFENLDAQEAGLGRAGEDRLAGGGAGDQHQLAVGDRDGRRPRAPGAGGRLPLLQPGRRPAAAGDHQRRADRRRHAGHRVRRRQGAAQVFGAGQGRPGVRGQPAAHPLHQRGLQGDRRRHPARRWSTRRSTRWACRCARSRCSSWSARRWPTTWARRCTAAFPDRFGDSPNLKKIVDAGLPLMVDDEINPEVAELVAGGSAPLTAEEVRANALDRPGRGDPPDARRGRRGRAAGHRPVHGPRRGLAVPPRRRHAVPGPQRQSRNGSPASASCPKGVASLPA